MTKTTKAQIRTLRTEAAQFGDLRMEAVCVLALGGPPALEGAVPGTEQALLLEEGMSQGEAVERCLEVLAAAAAAADVPDAIVVPTGTVREVREVLGSLEGLPDQEQGVLLIVSRIAAESGRAAGRTDLRYPAEVQRGTDGTPSHCLSLGVP